MSQSQRTPPLARRTAIVDKAQILTLLQHGTMEIEGLLTWSSNYAFLVQVCAEDQQLAAVYKPRRGERPLWDFPHGTLSYREMAAFLVSEALGWSLVSPMVLREGEHGLGSVQQFIEHDPDQHYFTIEGSTTFRTPLQKMVLLDVIINNADRKAGHVILETGSAEGGETPGSARERLWGIDHGICFHEEHKLRTVIWEFAGEPIPDSLLLDLQKLEKAVENPGGALTLRLQPLLDLGELRALRVRLRRLLRGKRFLNPGPGRHYPWPPV